MNTSRNGDIAEYIACAYLMHKGYDVFKNTGCTGVADLIAMSPDGDLTKVDVKKANYNNGIIYINTSCTNKASVASHGVVLLHVYVDATTFDIVCSDDVEDFYTQLEAKGYTTPNTSTKKFSATEYIIEHNGIQTTYLGIDALKAGIQLSSDRQYHYLTQGIKTVEGHSLVSKQKCTCTKNTDGTYLKV